MRAAIFILLLAACSGGHGNGTGTGTGSGTVITQNGELPARCQQIRVKVEGLYRAEAQQTEPKRVEEAVADNTTMVMNDCRKSPDQIAGCVESATTVAAIEHKCLLALDDEGTEGDANK